MFYSVEYSYKNSVTRLQFDASGYYIDDICSVKYYFVTKLSKALKFCVTS